MTHRYRVNYAQGQVSPSMPLAKARRHAADIGRGSYVERYEPGDAECPGEWFRYRPASRT